MKLTVLNPSTALSKTRAAMTPPARVHHAPRCARWTIDRFAVAMARRIAMRAQRPALEQTSHRLVSARVKSLQLAEGLPVLCVPKDKPVSIIPTTPALPKKAVPIALECVWQSRKRAGLCVNPCAAKCFARMGGSAGPTVARYAPASNGRPFCVD